MVKRAKRAAKPAVRKPAKKADTDEHIGIILVHGIGEHRRFEHLDGELRPLIKALIRRSEALPAEENPDSSRNVTVEIIAGGDSTLRADQDTWSTASGAPIRIVIRDGDVTKHIHVHEVWWADVNEPYSLRKQIYFWAWGLSIWNAPPRPNLELPGARVAMAIPEFPKGEAESPFSLRLRLFGVSNVFAMAAFSLGALIFFAKRLLGFSAPPIVQIFVNYIGAVKLYSQRHRSDGGFLDAFTEPPRVSIRRRMIRTIADVALANYDRWYIFAHSLGSVVAYNGLNENAHAIPNYLSEKQYGDLVAGIDGVRLAGSGRVEDYVGGTRDMLPARPVWLEKDAVVYRDRLYTRFRGLLTYGSPLDKFAAIWPARVPVNKLEKGLVTQDVPAEWINVYDPTDPVAGSLEAFNRPKEAGPDVVLEPRNFAYASSLILLLSHLHYFDGGKDRSRLSDRLMEWVLSGKSFSPPAHPSRRQWLEVKSRPYNRRRIGSWVTWFVVYVLLAMLGALCLPLWKSLVFDGGGALFEQMKKVWKNSFKPPETVAPSWPMIDSSLNVIRDAGKSIHDIVNSISWDWLVTAASWLWLLASAVGRFIATSVNWFDATFIVYPTQRLSLPEFGTDTIRLMVYVAIVTGVVGMIMRFLLTIQEPQAKAWTAGPRKASRKRTAAAKA